MQMNKDNQGSQEQYEQIKEIQEIYDKCGEIDLDIDNEALDNK